VILALIGGLMGGDFEDNDLRGLLGQSPIKQIPSHFGLIARCMLLLNGLSHRLAPGERVVQAAMLEAVSGFRFQVPGVPGSKSE
jgi:ubiquinone biosynthesis protein